MFRHVCLCLCIVCYMFMHGLFMFLYCLPMFVHCLLMVIHCLHVFVTKSIVLFCQAPYLWSKDWFIVSDIPVKAKLWSETLGTVRWYKSQDLLKCMISCCGLVVFVNVIYIQPFIGFDVKRNTYVVLITKVCMYVCVHVCDPQVVFTIYQERKLR